jgi:hypothetical protein
VRNRCLLYVWVLGLPALIRQYFIGLLLHC